MKKYLFGIMSIAFAVALVSFTSAEKNAKKYDCTWFVFDDNNDDIATQSEALNQLNYRLPSGSEDVNELCQLTDKICAICADQEVVNGVARPKITGQTIGATLTAYFGSGAGQNDPEAFDYPGQILEKLSVE